MHIPKIVFVFSGPTGGNNAIGRRIRSAARRASYSTIDNTMPTTKSSSQYLPMDKNGAGAVEENAADLSFLKRQEQWLRRRKESLESKIVAVEANEDVSFIFDCLRLIFFVNPLSLTHNTIPT